MTIKHWRADGQISSVKSSRLCLPAQRPPTDCLHFTRPSHLVQPPSPPSPPQHLCPHRLDAVVKLHSTEGLLALQAVQGLAESQDLCMGPQRLVRGRGAHGLLEHPHSLPNEQHCLSGGQRDIGGKLRQRHLQAGRQAGRCAGAGSQAAAGRRARVSVCLRQGMGTTAVNLPAPSAGLCQALRHQKQPATHLEAGMPL